MIIPALHEDRIETEIVPFRGEYLMKISITSGSRWCNTFLTKRQMLDLYHHLGNVIMAINAENDADDSNN